MAACHFCKEATSRHSHGLDREFTVTVAEDTYHTEIVVVCGKCTELIEIIAKGRVRDDNSD